MTKHIIFSGDIHINVRIDDVSQHGETAREIAEDHLADAGSKLATKLMKALQSFGINAQVDWYL